MEEFSFYMLKSFVWLSSFALIYLLFLKNERYFLLNRLYLLSGILVSIFFPLITVHYIIELPVDTIYQPDSHALSTLQQSTNSFFISVSILVLFIYLSGVLFFISRLTRQVISVYRIIKYAVPDKIGRAKLIRTREFHSPFSILNYIFVNPSINDIEMKEIVNHELIHIRQKHYLDLVLAELLYIGQWFNPFAWIYVRLIKQNHEYFTDEVVLQHSSNPGLYKAALLNQMFNSQVIPLTNSFNYSTNKKRFDMMKTIITSPYRKMKLLLVLPVFVIVFYSFAEPEYKYPSVVDNAENQNLSSATVSNVVNAEDAQNEAKLFQDTTIKKSTYTQLSAKEMPKFNGGDPAVEFRKYITENMKYPQIAKEKGITGKVIVQFVVDSQGKVMNAKVATSVDPSLDKEALRIVLSSPLWTPGKQNGKPVKVFYTFPVNFNLSGTMKEKSSSNETLNEEHVYTQVDNMPKFNGGDPSIEFRKFINENLKYPQTAKEKGIAGKVIVQFVVSSEGLVKDVKIAKTKQSSPEILNEEVINVVKASPAWTPGKHKGKAASVSYTFPINFILD